MIDPVIVLFAISLILFFGFFSEFIFRRFNIPDVLFLILLGIVLGPNVLGYIDISQISGLAPVFTTFTLLFLLFDGAFNINLSSLVREFSHSFVLTTFGFFVSTIVVALVMLIAGYGLLFSLLTGFVLGGVSSSFVIPILKEMEVSEKIYSLLTLESALTDVFCIVASLTVLEIYRLGAIGLRQVLTQIISLFAIAGLIGVLGGILWFFLIFKVFKEHNYMISIAYLLLVYVVTEFLSGNGAIAALCFGLMLKNSKQISSIIRWIATQRTADKKKALKGSLGESVTTPSEQFFYHQISFFLKTFFFVYIGLLLDLSDWKALVIGIILSFLLMGSRTASRLLTKGMDPENRSLVDSIFARGLAAAAVAQLALQAAFPQAEFLLKVSFITITGTIVLSSIRVFLLKRKFPTNDQGNTKRVAKKPVRG